ncbi:MAG: hypothetical protein Q4E65_09060 [Clostridia bacterium]|nr:hypothetical protein [Clostridia bacterium]
MKTLPFIIGIAAGITVAAAAVTSLYPDVPRRMMRDGKKMCRCGMRAMQSMF